MRERVQLDLYLHGAILLLAGLLWGIPYANAVAHGWREYAVRGWHVAHTGVVSGALTILVLGATLPRLALGAGAAPLFAWSLVGSGYAFLVALTDAPVAGVRGLVMTGPPANLLAWTGDTIAAAASLLALVLAIWGALAALRRPDAR